MITKQVCHHHMLVALSQAPLVAAVNVPAAAAAAPRAGGCGATAALLNPLSEERGGYGGQGADVALGRSLTSVVGAGEQVSREKEGKKAAATADARVSTARTEAASKRLRGRNNLRRLQTSFFHVISVPVHWVLRHVYLLVKDCATRGLVACSSSCERGARERAALLDQRCCFCCVSSYRTHTLPLAKDAHQTRDVSARASRVYQAKQELGVSLAARAYLEILVLKALLATKERKGENGVPGFPGTAGSMGLLGEVGPLGPSGYPGCNGTDGRPGTQGLNGFPGPRGSQGPDGFKGPPGEAGDGGINSQGVKGDRGDPGIDGGTVSETGHMFSSSLLVEGHSAYRDLEVPLDGEEKLVIRQGMEGESGRLGTPGLQGPEGLPGIYDPTFDEEGKFGVGYPGLIGPPGPRGEPGDDKHGRQGDTGDHGEQGDQGAPGKYLVNGGENGYFDATNKTAIATKGPKGVKGYYGENGQHGRKGETGSKGPSGAYGLQGLKGMKGGFGDDGPRGKQGKDGPPGPSGSKGFKGAPGYAGQDGPDGFKVCIALYFKSTFKKSRS
ncbi:hypothetical protein B566_EDAN001402 [Ephemera danica]|nr:hypothetical protein B566_EDAN001402 [Ephemera danica]